MQNESSMQQSKSPMMPPLTQAGSIANNIAQMKIGGGSNFGGIGGQGLFSGPNPFSNLSNQYSSIQEMQVKQSNEPAHPAMNDL
jgi:hypothetical protein